jgi:hypothetical protein
MAGPVHLHCSSIFRAGRVRVGLKKILLFRSEKIIPMIIPLDVSGLNFRAGPELGRAARVFYSVKQLKTSFRVGLGKKKFAGFKISARARPVRFVGGPGAARAQNAQVYLRLQKKFRFRLDVCIKAWNLELVLKTTNVVVWVDLRIGIGSTVQYRRGIGTTTAAPHIIQTLTPRHSSAFTRCLSRSSIARAMATTSSSPASTTPPLLTPLSSRVSLCCSLRHRFGCCCAAPAPPLPFVPKFSVVPLCRPSLTCVDSVYSC